MYESLQEKLEGLLDSKINYIEVASSFLYINFTFLKQLLENSDTEVNSVFP